MKDKQQPMQPHGSNLNLLRQELKNKLIKIGMAIDGERESTGRAKKMPRGKTEEDECLPSLQSYRNKHFHNDIKEVFEFNYQQMLRQRINKRQLSRQVIRGLKCQKSVNSSRDASSSDLKDKVHKKLVQSTKAQRLSHKLPAMALQKRPNERQMSQTIRIVTIDKPYDTDIISKFQRRQKSHRYKTEQKEQADLGLSRSHKKLKKTLGKDLSPWQMDLARDTNIYFN